MKFAPDWATLSSYFAAIFFALPLLTASAYGYGAALTRLLAAPMSAAMTVGLGISALIFAGGLLDLAALISVKTIWILMLGGCACALASVIHQRSQWMVPRLPVDWVQLLLLLLVIACVGSILFGHSFYPDLNQYDDLPGYSVFPQKMLDLGQLGPEPFSERRLTTSLGGIYFLQTLVLALADRWHLHLIDPVLGSLLMMAVIYQLTRSSTETPARGMVAALFSAVLVPNLVNLSATTLPAALLCLLYCIVDKQDERKWPLGRAIIIGMITAAALGLKSNVLPFVVTFLAIFYLIAFARRPSFHLLLEAGLAAIATVAFALPWMIVHFLDTGTPLFPILGKGGHGSQYGYYFDFNTAHSIGGLTSIFVTEFVLTGPFVATLGGFILAIGAAWRTGPVRSNLLALVPAVMAGGFALTVGTGGEGVIRYAYPGLAASAALAIAEGLRTSGAPMRLRISDAMLALVMVIAIGLHREYIGKYVAFAVRNVGIAVFGPELRPQMFYARVETTGAASSIKAMQQAVPAGAAILERLDFPFLLDFQRNPVFVNDIPGGASPPPGLPLFQGPEPLAEYLLQQRIQYVAYAWRSEALLPESGRNLLLSSPWIDAAANSAFDFQRNLAILMTTRRLLYRDDERAVIDLADRISE